MGVIEFHKVIFKACFCQTFKGYSCSIDTEVGSAGMSRNTFGVDGELTIFFGYLIFLELRPGKCGSSFFFRPSSSGTMVVQVSHIALDTKPPFMEMIRVFFEQAIMASDLFHRGYTGSWHPV